MSAEMKLPKIALGAWAWGKDGNLGAYAYTAIVEGKILNGANSVDSLRKWVETIL